LSGDRNKPVLVEDSDEPSKDSQNENVISPEITLLS
jgi:hypothetical protein